MAEFSALLTATAEWKPHQIAKAGDIASLAAAATSLAETVKASLSLASAGMEVVKLLAMLQNINPLLIALDALADEVLKQITDLKEAGYYYLYVDPYFEKNITPIQQYNYGFEQLRNEGGKRLFLEKNKDTGEYVERVEGEGFPTAKQIEDDTARPSYASPRKLIPGGYDSNNPTVDPLTLASKYPQFPVKDVIKEFTKAFDDAGDVPRYKVLGKQSSVPTAGTDVYDVDGNVYSGWDPAKDFGLALFDKGKVSEDGQIVKNYVAARKAINSKVAPGKPNILGNTEFDGGCGAIAIIVAAGAFDTFQDVFNEFSKMFSDIPEFASTTGKNLQDSLLEIITPNDVTLKLTQVDTDYGIFLEGDIIGGKRYGSYGTIRTVNTSATVATTMTGTSETKVVDDIGDTIFLSPGVPATVKKTINMNENERWVDMEVLVSPIRGIDGLNPWIPGDTVLEQEQRGTYGTTGTDLFPNYVMKGLGTTGSPHALRVYPKVGKVDGTSRFNSTRFWRNSNQGYCSWLG